MQIARQILTVVELARINDVVRDFHIRSGPDHLAVFRGNLSDGFTDRFGESISRIDQYGKDAEKFLIVQAWHSQTARNPTRRVVPYHLGSAITTSFNR